MTFSSFLAGINMDTLKWLFPPVFLGVGFFWVLYGG